MVKSLMSPKDREPFCLQVLKTHVQIHPPRVRFIRTPGGPCRVPFQDRDPLLLASACKLSANFAEIHWNH